MEHVFFGGSSNVLVNHFIITLFPRSFARTMILKKMSLNVKLMITMK